MPLVTQSKLCGSFLKSQQSRISKNVVVEFQIFGRCLWVYLGNAGGIASWNQCSGLMTFKYVSLSADPCLPDLYPDPAFCHWPSKRQQKTNSKKFFCPLLFEGTSVHVHIFSKISPKEVNKGIFFLFCLMIEGWWKELDPYLWLMDPDSGGLKQLIRIRITAWNAFHKALLPVCLSLSCGKCRVFDSFESSLREC